MKVNARLLAVIASVCAILGLILLNMGLSGLGYFLILVSVPIALNTVFYNYFISDYSAMGRQRVMPRLKELSSIRVMDGQGRQATFEGVELDSLKKLMKKIRVINSVLSREESFEIQVSDVYGGLWDLELIRSDTEYEFVVNRVYFGGSCMSELGKKLSGKLAEQGT